MKALEGKKTQKLEKVKNFFKFWSAGQLDALFWGLLSFLKLFILKTNINVSVIRRNYAKKFRKKYFIFVTLSATEENNRIRIRNQWQCCVIGIVLIPIRIDFPFWCLTRSGPGSSKLETSWKIWRNFFLTVIHNHSSDNLHCFVFTVSVHRCNNFNIFNRIFIMRKCS